MKPFSDNYEKQKRFITDAGHELRTPLTIINADTEVFEIEMWERKRMASGYQEADKAHEGFDEYADCLVADGGRNTGRKC